MGYSKNADVVAKVKDFLDSMSTATDSLKWASPDPHKLAYHIREALAYTASHSDSPYHSLKEKFVIRARGNFVIAEPRITAPLAVLQQTLSKMVIDDVTDLFGVVGAAIRHKGQELHFPNCTLDVEGLSKLYLWTSLNDYYIVQGDGITLTKSDPGELAWKPQK